MNLFGFKIPENQRIDQKSCKFTTFTTFVWNIIQNLGMKICPKSFRPKRSFVASIPDDLHGLLEPLALDRAELLDRVELLVLDRVGLLVLDRLDLGPMLCRVARFFMVRHTKMRKIYQMTTKCTEWPYNLPICLKIYQLAVKYTKWPHN
jgi:hypothetical protein